MRITGFETFRADGGWRPFSFLKIATDESLVGWSEFVEGPWSPRLDDIIVAIGRNVLGEDPRGFARISALLHATTQFAAGGLNHQAIAAIENACIDIAAKAAGLPVHRLFGGPFRSEIELYWSHCGTFRVPHAEFFERVLHKPALRTLDDVRRLGQEAAAAGYRAVKTNPIVIGSAGPHLLNPGFVPRGLRFERTIDEPTLRGIVAQVEALRDGLGADRGLMLDCNLGFRPDALRRIVHAVQPACLAWLEVDLHDPEALRGLRASGATPIASLESLHGRRAYRPFLEANAVDVAIVDVPWNGFAEAIRIASLAEAHDTNVAPHNFYGPLADLMSAQFCAAVPNVAIMEIEGDDVPWKDDLLTRPSRIVDGRFLVPATFGWGADVDEDAVRAHPWSGARAPSA